MNILELIHAGAIAAVQADPRPLYQGMSDDQLTNEYKAQERLAKAIYEMERAIEFVNHASAVESISVTAFQNFVHDEMPCTRDWEERIAAARNL